MSRPLVVASHLAGAQRFRSKKYGVSPVPCGDDPADYWRGLVRAWQSTSTIINVEHDMEVSDALIDELVECPESLCTHAYRLYWPSTHKPGEQFAHRDGGDVGGPWVEEGATSANFSGIGFCKIAPEARIAPLAETSWQILDVEVHRAKQGRWHIHWPGVEHYHR